MSFRPRVTLASPLLDECRTLSEWLVAEGYEPSTLTNPARLTDELRTRAIDMLVVDARFAAAAIAALRARNAQLPIAILGDVDPAAEARRFPAA